MQQSFSAVFIAAFLLLGSLLPSVSAYAKTDNPFRDFQESIGKNYCLRSLTFWDQGTGVVDCSLTYLSEYFGEVPSMCKGVVFNSTTDGDMTAQCYSEGPSLIGTLPAGCDSYNADIQQVRGYPVGTFTCA